MARKSNEEIRKMGIAEAEQYAHDHPAESGRISKELMKAGTKCTKIYIEYSVKNAFSPNPSSVTVTL